MNAITNKDIAMNLFKEGQVINTNQTRDYMMWAVKSYGQTWLIYYQRRHKGVENWYIHQIPKEDQTK